MLQLAAAVRRARSSAVERRVTVMFFIDLDDGSFWAEEYGPPHENFNEYEASGTDLHDAGEQSHLVFLRAKNSRQEVTGGSISFTIRPDASIEFGIVDIFDPETGEYYTLFLNPYFSDPEIIKGAWEPGARKHEHVITLFDRRAGKGQVHA